MIIPKESNRKLMLFASVIIPDLESDEKLRALFWNNFQRLFSGFDEEIQSKLLLLIKVMAVFSYLYNFKPFDKLSIIKREKFIAQLFKFPFAKFVSGLNGLKTLCFIAFYNIEEVYKEINYDGPLV